MLGSTATNSLDAGARGILYLDCFALFLACDSIVPEPDWVRFCRRLTEMLGLAHRRGKFPHYLSFYNKFNSTGKNAWSIFY